jgi:hypothetical protein
MLKRLDKTHQLNSTSFHQGVCLYEQGIFYNISDANLQQNFPVTVRKFLPTGDISSCQ